MEVFLGYTFQPITPVNVARVDVYPDGNNPVCK